MDEAQDRLSDHVFLRGILVSFAKLEKSRRLTMKEIDQVKSLRRRWSDEGERLVLAPEERGSLTIFVQRLEERVKKHPYPVFF